LFIQNQDIQIGKQSSLAQKHTWTHHLKLGSCIKVLSRNFCWNNSCTGPSKIPFSKMSKLPK